MTTISGVLIGAGVAALAATGGYADGINLAERAIISGGQYASGIKKMPEADELDDALIETKIFCRITEEATGAMPAGCEGIFANETHGEPE